MSITKGVTATLFMLGLTWAALRRNDRALDPRNIVTGRALTGRHTRGYDYAMHATCYPPAAPGGQPMSEVFKQLVDTVRAAMQDEAGYVEADAAGYLEQTPTTATYKVGAYGVDMSREYAYYARAIPEAFGYTTAQSDTGAILVTTDMGEYIGLFCPAERIWA